MATVPYFTTSRRHQRSHSQLQQLIPLSSQQQQQEIQQPNTSTWPPFQLRQPKEPSKDSNKSEKGVRLSILGSESSSYYRLPGISNENNSNDGIDENGTRGRCLRLLEENLKLLIGSLALAIFGTALIFFSFFVTFLPNDMG
ncbi:hypothetical protein Mgra_00001363 [Meloidogyne graminicola]|uniref:Uncharacterized protein n=1 Tax=Meloidogyne graminicola TaxID=189291 RepID=A0A8T0A0W6_9BILA|nr:hypothetical protein Mgra_00001363 [Meloidogyne graminicola]